LRLQTQKERRIIMITSTSTASMAFTYSQILGLAMQLPEQEKYTLCRDLTQGWRTKELRAIRDSIRNCDLSDDEIRQECEIVRQKTIICCN